MARQVDEAQLIEIGGPAAARLARRMAAVEDIPMVDDTPDVEALLRRWRSRGVPALALARALSGTELWPTESLHGARQLRRARWGLLVGSVGCGKSTAAAWWLTQFKSGLWRFSRHVARLPDGAQWATQELTELERAPALVLDDVGWRDTGSRGQLAGPVQEVLMTRVEEGLPTLCTSNLAPASVLRKAGASGLGLVSWEEYLGEARLRDRWAHCGRWHKSEQGSLRGFGGDKPSEAG